MADNKKELIIAEMLESDEIKQIYEDYIMKEIPFEDWVRSTVHDLMNPVQVDVDVILAKIMKEDNNENS